MGNFFLPTFPCFMSRAKIITDGDLEVSFLLACFVVWSRQSHYAALWIDLSVLGILFIMRNYLKRPADGGWRVLPNGCDICGRKYFRCLCLCLYVCLSVYLTCLYWRRSKGVSEPSKHHAIKTLDVAVQLHIFLALAIDWRLVTCYRLSCEKSLERRYGWNVAVRWMRELRIQEFRVHISVMWLTVLSVVLCGFIHCRDSSTRWATTGSVNVLSSHI